MLRVGAVRASNGVVDNYRWRIGSPAGECKHGQTVWDAMNYITTGDVEGDNGRMQSSMQSGAHASGQRKTPGGLDTWGASRINAITTC